MLLAIDVGNTHTVFGLWDGKSWVAQWRRHTNAEDTEEEIAAWFSGLVNLAKLPFEFEGAICASVVPPLEHAISKFGKRWLGTDVHFLRDGAAFGLEVIYEPPTAVGADRLANALGALRIAKPPIVVVDFGTATTFDCIDKQGRYVGGAILPGVTISSQALMSRTAKLPQIALEPPKHAVGKSTVESLQSGLVLGYAGAIDSLVEKLDAELGGGTTVIATGGLGATFMGIAKRLQSNEPTLTLDGLRLAYEKAR